VQLVAEPVAKPGWIGEEEKPVHQTGHDSLRRQTLRSFAVAN
jgi:hypothetical protein